MNVFKRIVARNVLLMELLNGNTTDERKAEIVELLYGNRQDELNG
jgi:hypothetical protein